MISAISSSDAADQPQPAGLEIVEHQPSILGRAGNVGERRAGIGSASAWAGAFGPSLIAEHFPGQLADAAQRAHQLGRLDREQDRLGVGRGRELADRLDIFLGDEIVDRLARCRRRSRR